jgi:hypothetical protein
MYPDISQVLTTDIFSLLGLESLSDEEKESLLTQMNQVVLARVYLKAGEQLGPDKVQYSESLPNDKYIEFLHQEGIDLANLIITEAFAYRAELASAMGHTTPQVAIA